MKICELYVSIQLLWLAVIASVAVQARVRVAVVGAGVGGAFTATRIAELAHPSFLPEVEVFEAESQEGGRVQEFLLGGEVMELGASIFWDQNRYIKTAAQQLGLKLRRLGARGSSGGDRSSDRSGGGGGGGGTRQGGSRGTATQGFTVWNGTAFVVNMTGAWCDKLYAATRYGTAALRYKWLVRDAFERFRRVYDMQATGTSWDAPDALLRDLGLFNATQQRCSDYMRDWLQQPLWWLWGGAAFADEVAGAANRCNYNQNNEQMNAFAGMVSYMPAAYGAVWQVEGGNRQLVSGLLAASGARLLAAARVTAVRRQPEDGRYFLEVRWSGGGGLSESGSLKGEKEEEDEGKETTAAVVEESSAVESNTKIEVFGPYDAVVIAAPLIGSEIRLDLDCDGDDSNVADGSCSERNGRTASATATCAASETVLQQPYQVTVTTYVLAGRLRPSYFNVVQVPKVARVFVTSGAKVPFSSLSLIRGPMDRSDGGGSGSNGSSSGGGGGGGGDLVVAAGQRVYKIFSQEELSMELLKDLFEVDPDPPRVLASRRWYAYPRFQPPERFSPFLLAPGLVYGNALEPAAAAMEIAAIGAYNSAVLIVRHLDELRAAEAEARNRSTAVDGAEAVLATQ